MLNVVVLLAPAAISPVSQVLALLVDVCVTPELFVHVIVVPFAIVMVDGLNTLPAMLIVFVVPPPDGGGVVLP